MKLPRNLSGVELIRLLTRHFDYARVNQEGSHAILQTNDPRQHRISIPCHESLRVGTLNSILRAVAKAKGCEREDILGHL